MTTAPSGGPVTSPYVGPRPFRRGELFFGRERETTGLVDTLLASRIVLLHSPSAAGKTSLLQAAVAPEMERRDFQLCVQRAPFSPARVSTPATLKADNSYAAGVVSCLLAHRNDLDRARTFTISDALDLLAKEPGAPDQQLLMIDQFEEVLILDPTDFEGQKAFFRQLGAALDSRNRWALIAMREDFMGGLDCFLRYIPGHLRTTFRLDLLKTESAKLAIRLPSEKFGVDFTDDAATGLIRDLQLIRTGRADDRRGTYVEPVFVQVVCDSLWRRVHEQHAVVSSITTKDLTAFGPLDAALAVYYNWVLKEASRGSRPVEREIREWIERQLLTKDHLRRQTMTRPNLPDADADAVMTVLQDRYLVRGDRRGETVWWELSHDRMSSPIVDDNEAWRQTLEPWQRAAYEWHRRHHDERYLARGERLRAARAYRRKKHRLTDVEKEYLERSEAAAATQKTLDRATSRINILFVILSLSLTLNAALVAYFLRKRKRPAN